MKTLFAFLLSFLFTVFFYLNFQAQLIEEIVVETEDLSYLGDYTDLLGVVQDFNGFTAYRIYAIMEGNDDAITTIHGLIDNNDTPDLSDDLNHLLSFQTTTGFFNHPVAGILGSHVPAQEALFDFSPALQFDSFLTIGVENEASPGASSLSTVSIPNNAFDFLEINGHPGVSGLDNTAIFITPDQEASYADEEGRIFLGQLVTDGEFCFEINLSLIDGGIGGVDTRIVSRKFQGGLVSSGIDGCPLGTIYPQPNDCGNIDAGCTDSEACNFNPCVTEDDGSCAFLCGCTNPEACNYDDTATSDDGSCDLTSCYGCTDITSCNFSASATIDDGSCAGEMCGCTDSEACNYNDSALADDGSCDFDSCSGCTDPLACNYDETALIDSGVCEFESCVGCTDETAANFDPEAIIASNDLCCYSTTFFTLEFTPGLFPNEIGWAVSDDSDVEYASGGFTESLDLCIPEGCYTFEMTDTFGDGWNGAVYSLFDSEGNLLYTGDLDTADIGDGSVEGLDFWSLGAADCPFGCTTPQACNFDPDATLDDNSCVLPSCIDPLACNYDDNPNACAGGDCQYEAVVSGYVFNDLNQNGLYEQGGFDEYGLANRQVTIQELNLNVYTDLNGYFEFFNVPAGSYTLALSDLGEDWEATGSSSLTISTTNCELLNNDFGVVAAGTAPVFISGPCCIFMMDIHCELGFNPGLWVNNTGSIPLNGTITVEYDPILEGEPHGYPAEDPSSIEPGIVTWDISNHLGGQNLLYQSHIIGPGFEFMGQEFPVTITLSLLDENDEEYYNNVWVLEPIVVCSYDPNDKYTEFPGYTEEHFILPDETMEYRIRFQNTGNFLAFNVNIKDSLDVEHLDLSTFTPIVSSHSMMTSVDDEGHVEFIFDNIMLPDSASDEPGSQGYLVYQIRPRADVDPGDVINNTAHIFFDANPAIVTNTTWHTIYECPAQLFTEEGEWEICVGQEFEFTLFTPHMENVAWEDDLGQQWDGPSFNHVYDESGLYTINVTADNPLCAQGITGSGNVSVFDYPEASFYVLDDVLYAEETGYGYQWLLNGEEIEGATESTYAITESGNYSLMASIQDCSTTSQEVNVMLGIEAWNTLSITAYPNPVEDLLTLSWDSADALEAILFDQLGRVVVPMQILQSGEPIDLSSLPAGIYSLRVNDQHLIRIVKE